MFAIAAGDIVKYQGGHMMRNAHARTVRSRQETVNSNGGHDLFMVRNIKCGYSFSYLGREEHIETKFKRIR